MYSVDYRMASNSVDYVVTEAAIILLNIPKNDKLDHLVTSVL